MRILALDVGERRIGVAVSDPSGTLARPLRTLMRRGTLAEVVESLAAEIETAGAEDGAVDTVVVGLPTRLDGSDSDQTPRVRKLAAALAKRLRVPVVFQDERLTSREAESRLALRERDWRKRKRLLDAAAAAVILQDYLDARSRDRSLQEELPDR
jgi:putative Holliday junction resolvase